MTEKVKCPYCGKRVTLTATNRVRVHNNPSTKSTCPYGGGKYQPDWNK